MDTLKKFDEEQSNDYSSKMFREPELYFEKDLGVIHNF